MKTEQKRIGIYEQACQDLDVYLASQGSKEVTLDLIEVTKAIKKAYLAGWATGNAVGNRDKFELINKVTTDLKLEAYKRDFDNYERIRSTGTINMLAYHGIYGFVMDHYSELAKKFPEIIEKYNKSYTEVKTPKG